jgi:hypothetical protein
MRKSWTTRAAAALFSLLGVPLGAEISILIVPPRLKPGMAQLQTMLEQEVGAVGHDLADIAGAYLLKPLFMSANAHANGSAILPSVVPARPGDVLSVALGCSAAAQTDTWDIALLTQRVDGFKIEDDYAVGAGVRPLALDLTLPLGSLLRGLDLRLTAGFMQAEILGYTFRSIAAGVFVDYAFVRPRGWGSILSWRGLSIGLGAAGGENRLSTVVAPGVVERTLSFDPDGAGPLPVFNVDIQADPRVSVAVASSALVFPCVLSTGITILDSLTFTVGGGVDLSTGGTSVGVDGDPEVTILGHLADLIEEPGRVELSGSVGHQNAATVRPLVFGNVLFRVGPYFVAVSGVYRAAGGLAVDASLGVSLR